MILAKQLYSISSSNIFNTSIKPWLRVLTKSFFLFLVFLFGTGHVFAASIQAQEFTSDASTTFLAVIFGRVSDSFSSVLGTQERPILAVAFEYYNGFIAVVGVVVVTYITVVGLANSAHSGTPMGQKWHTLFLPMRVTIGAGMLVPNASGYNVAQVLMMWFILTGVHGADTVWNYVIAEFQTRGNSAVGGGTKSIADGDMKAFFGAAVKFAGCVGSAGMHSVDYPPLINLLSLTCQPNASGDCADATSIRPTDDKVFENCGQLNVTVGGQLRGEDADTRRIRSSLMLRLQGSVLADLIDYIRRELNLSNNVAAPDLKDKIQSYLETALPGMMNDVSSIVADKQRLLAVNSPTYDKEKRIGWMAAGASYYKFVKSGSGGGDDSTNYSAIITRYVNPPTATKTFSYPILTQVQDALNGAKVSLGGSSGAATVGIQFEPSMESNLIMDILSIGIRPLSQWVVKMILRTDSLFGYPDSVDILDPASLRAALNKDPIAGVANRGSELTMMVEMFFFITVMVLVATAAASMALSAIPYITTGLAMIIPIVAGVIVAIFSIIVLFYPIGIIMNIYIPLIPFLIYTFGVLGWFLICVEAMAAGPIVAIGLMHPDGNEVLGKAEQGLMLILNLMLRPVLMIVGLVAAIIMVRVILLIFSWGMNTVLETGILPVESLGAVVGLMIIYVGSIGMLVHKAFGLINQVPDKLMAWIGSTTGGVGEATEFLQTAERKAGEGGGMPSQMVTQGKAGFSQGMKAGQQASKPPAGPSGGGGGAGAGP